MKSLKILFVGNSFAVDTMQYVANYLNQTVHSVLKLPRDKAVFIEEGATARIVSKLVPYKDKPICVEPRLG